MLLPTDKQMRKVKFFELIETLINTLHNGNNRPPGENVDTGL